MGKNQSKVKSNSFNAKYSSNSSEDFNITDENSSNFCFGYASSKGSSPSQKSVREPKSNIQVNLCAQSLSKVKLGQHNNRSAKNIYSSQKCYDATKASFETHNLKSS